MTAMPAICPERALLITESYRETEGQPMVLRRAKALERILANMSIFIEKDQLIVGNQAGQVRAAPIFPEYSIDWVIEELDQFDQRSGDVFAISEDAKEKLRGIQAFWQGKTHQEAVYADISETNMAAQSARTSSTAAASPCPATGTSSPITKKCWPWATAVCRTRCSENMTARLT